MTETWTGRWVREPSTITKGWITRWSLKQYIGEDESREAVETAASRLHEKLERYRVYSCAGRWADDDEIAGISDEFHTAAYCDKDNPDYLEYFNLALSALYDWADSERVIIG